MKKNKIVIFDWGNVIENHHDPDLGWYKITEDLINYFGGNGFSFDRWATFEDKGNSYKISAINDSNMQSTWIKYIINYYKLNCSEEDFINKYKELYDKVIYYKDVVNILHETANKCYVGIFSNLLWLDKERLDKQVNLDKLDYVFLSFEMEDVKPNKDIYLNVQKSLNINIDDILFIDDREDNINTAFNLGWNTLCTTGENPELIRETINDFLGEIE